MLTSSNMRCGAQQQPQRQRQRQWQENCNERKENDEKNWTLLTIQWIQFNSIQLHINWLKIEFQLNNSWWIYCANAEQLLRIINKTIFSINQIEQKKNFLDFTFDCAETPCDVICNKITELTKKWNRKMKWNEMIMTEKTDLSDLFLCNLSLCGGYLHLIDRRYFV